MASARKVWGDYPVYYKNPIRFCRYHAHVNPHLFLSVVLGVSGPLLLLLTPLRRKFLYEDYAPVPYTYPLPTRARDATLTGFDDE
ncbi:N19M [[Candida] subhashii]|uniref:N19M n=1 Tax=[Candida] subhashii TaxID=561895 RepID=A0A8J5QI14_9ASCO|nr:N19M [[Candida] subhashii]KAG7666014.1 N19M [[Candida] subhashii]